MNYRFFLGTLYDVLLPCAVIEDADRKRVSFRDGEFALSRSTECEGSRSREHGAGASGRGSAALEETGSRAAQDCVRSPQIA